MKKLLSYVLTLFLLIPSVFAAASSAPTVASSFSIFYQGIKLGLKGNAAALAVGLVAILPVIGVTVIVFGLIFFITKVSIFRSPEHDKYARMIAYGIALIGLAQQSIFNTILNLSTTFLILSFLVAVVFMFIMFVNHGRKEHLTSHAELHKITGNALGARRDLEKIKHELKHEEALYRKTETDLAQLDSDLNNISHLVGSELTQVDKVAGMLRKAAAAHQSGNSAAVNQYVTSLSKDLGGLITTMQHEQKHEHHLSHLVSQIESELAKWGHSADKDKSEEDHLEKLFHKFSESWGSNAKEKEIKDLFKEEHDLIKLLKTMRQHLHNLQSFYDRIMSDTQDLEKASYERKHMEAAAVRDNIMNQQFTEAHKHLDNLRAIIEYEPHVIKRFKKHERELLSLISHIHNEELSINQLLKGKLSIALEKMRTSAKKKDGATNRLLGGLDEYISTIAQDLKKYASYAHKIVVDIKGDISFNEPSRKEVHDLPEKLLSRFLDLEHQFTSLLDKVSHDKKDGKTLELHRKKAIIYLKSLEDLIDPAIRTVHHAKGGDNNHRYQEVLHAIEELLNQSKKSLFGTGHSLLAKLEDLK